TSCAGFPTTSRHSRRTWTSRYTRRRCAPPEAGGAQAGAASGRLEERAELLGRGRLVGLIERGQLGRQPVHRGLVDLPLRKALVGLAGVAMQVADHLGDRDRVTRVDLRLVFLRAAR